MGLSLTLLLAYGTLFLLLGASSTLYTRVYASSYYILIRHVWMISLGGPPFTERNQRSNAFGKTGDVETGKKGKDEGVARMYYKREE